MYDNLYIAVMHIREESCRIAMEDVGIEFKGRLRFIPATRCKPGSEVDDRINGYFFIPESIYYPNHLVFVHQGSVGLHITKCPLWRHSSRTGDHRKFFHQFSRI